MLSDRVIQIISLLVFLGGLFGSAQGQSVCTISKTYEKTTLDKVVQDLIQTCDIVVSYDPDRLAAIEVASLNFTNIPVQEALFDLTLGRDLEVVQVEAGKFALAPRRGQVDSSRVVLRKLFGVVVDGGSGTELPGVAVVIGDSKIGPSNLGVLTDEKGRFEMVVPSDQGDFLEARSLGYQPTRESIPPAGGPVVLVISELPLELETVMVTGRQEQVFSAQKGNQSVDVRLSPRHLGAISVLGEKDVFRSMQMLPGVSATEESSNGVFVRGSTPDQTLVLIDGVPVYNTGHFFGMFHAFNADALERVDVSRGGFNVSQGGAVGGLIQIESKPRLGDSLSGGISANLAATSAHVSLPLANDRIAVMVAGRRSYSDILQSPLYSQISGNVFQVGSIKEASDFVEENDSAFFEADPLSNFHDIHFKSVFDLKKKGELTASFYNGRDAVSYNLQQAPTEDSVTLTAEERLTLVNNAGGVKYRVDLRPNLEMSAQTFLTNFRGRLSYDYRLVEEVDSLDLFSEQDNQVTTAALRNSYHWRPNDRNQLQLGWQLTFTGSSFFLSDENSQEEEDPDDEEEEGIDSLGLGTSILALWAGYSAKPHKNVTLSPGIRVSRYGLDEEFYFEPRLQASWKMGKKWNLNGNVGYYLQYLNPVQINNNLKLGTEFLTLASEDNGVEGVLSWQGGLGVSYIAPGIWADAQFYYKYMDGIQRYTREFDAGLNGNLFGDRLSDGQGEVIGADFFVRGMKGPWTGWVGYTISSVVHYFDSLNSGNPFPADHDHLHELKLAQIVKWKRWEFSMQWTLASGKPYSEPTSIETITTDNDTFPELRFDLLNFERLPAYHRLDINASYQLRPWKWATSTVGISIFNLYNRTNIRDRNFALEYDENDELEVNTIDRVLLGFSPNIFFRLSF